MTRILICGQFAFMGAILLLLPNMTRRSLLFAVPVAEDFRNTAEARQAMGLYRWVVAVGIALGLAALVTIGTGTVNVVAPFGLLAVTGVSYYKANRLIAPFAVKSDGTRSVVLSDAPERLPRFVWLAGAPLNYVTVPSPGTAGTTALTRVHALHNHEPATSTQTRRPAA
jgi:uncharacterized membrane protein